MTKYVYNLLGLVLFLIFFPFLKNYVPLDTFCLIQW